MNPFLLLPYLRDVLTATADVAISTQVKLFSGVAVGTGVASYAGAVQTVLTPNDTLLPIGVVIGLFLAAMTATAKVVRLVDGINRRLDEIEDRMKEEK